MKDLVKIRAMAKLSAIRDGAPVVILNLNKYGPLYVVRDYWTGCEQAPSYVETVQPV